MLSRELLRALIRGGAGQKYLSRFPVKMNWNRKVKFALKFSVLTG